MNTKFTFSKMTEADARDVLAWRYEEPYDHYDGDPHDIPRLVEPTNLYLSVRGRDGELIAYYCFGAEAQVSGGDYSEPALDISGRTRPDLLGTGFGEMFVRVAMDFGTMFFKPERFRTTIPAFNSRAIHMCEKAGFALVDRFTTGDGREYVLLTKDVEKESGSLHFG